MHRIYLDSPPPTPSSVLHIEGDEAAHALRVKRLAPGDAVELLDGQGTIARAVVVGEDEKTPGQPLTRRHRRERTLAVRIEDSRRFPPIRPRVEVCTSTPKGSRVDELIDSLSQLGVALWRPLRCARSVVHPRESKLDRIERLAREACKQAGRAWIMEIGAPISLADALTPAPGALIILADPSGDPAPPALPENLRLLIGPEGGFTDDELAAARRAGVTLSRFGPYLMRIETAAAAASAVLLAGSTVQP